MTVTVTGASGHAGANLVRALLAQGREVRALTVEPLDQCPPALVGHDVERVSADLRDGDAVRRALEGSEVVFHLAAHVSLLERDRELSHAINVDGTGNVVDACLDTGVQRLVHFSSIQALSPFPLDQAVDESRPPALDQGLPPYSHSKALGEQKVQAGIERGLDAVIVNPTSLFGPFDFAPSPVGRTLVDIWEGRLPGVVRGGFDWVDVRDVVDGALAAEAYGRRGERYLLGGSWASLAEFASIAAAVAGTRPPRLVLPMTVARAAAPAAVGWSRLRRSAPRFTPASLLTLRQYHHVSHEKATRELGYRPRSLEETLADTLAWHRARASLLLADSLA